MWIYCQWQLEYHAARASLPFWLQRRQHCAMFSLVCCWDSCKQHVCYRNCQEWGPTWRGSTCQQYVCGLLVYRCVANGNIVIVIFTLCCTFTIWKWGLYLGIIFDDIKAHVCNCLLARSGLFYCFVLDREESNFVQLKGHQSHHTFEWHCNWYWQTTNVSGLSHSKLQFRARTHLQSCCYITTYTIAVYWAETKACSIRHSIVSTKGHIQERLLSVVCDSCTAPGQHSSGFLFGN